LLGGFTKQYGLKELVYFEQHDDIRSAIQREKAIKHWSRAWKVRLIHAQNPDWRDLFETLIQDVDARHKAGHDGGEAVRLIVVWEE
jgi:putative endonuclease